jgi:hypothetical protein
LTYTIDQAALKAPPAPAPPPIVGIPRASTERAKMPHVRAAFLLNVGILIGYFAL